MPLARGGMLRVDGRGRIWYHTDKERTENAMKLTLIRHGITQGNKEGLYYGATDLPLLDEGIADLQRRKTSHTYPTAPRYYTSPLQRTQQTLKEVYGDVDFTVIHDFREMNFGACEMRTVEDLKNDPDFVAWSRDPSFNRCPGGESFADVQCRALQGVAPLLTSQEDTVCVIHGGVIACMMFKWFPGKAFDDWMIHPGTGWQITVEDGKPVSYVPVPFTKE